MNPNTVLVIFTVLNILVNMLVVVAMMQDAKKINIPTPAEQKLSGKKYAEIDDMVGNGLEQ